MAREPGHSSEAMEVDEATGGLFVTHDSDSENGEEPEAPEFDLDLAKDALPAAWNLPRTYRFTRDNPKWPSAGPVGSEVNNIQQAQHSVMADVLFETIKVKLLKAKKSTAKGLLGEHDPAAYELAEDVNAQEAIFPLLDKFVEDGGSLKRTVSKHAPQDAEGFLEFLERPSLPFDTSYEDASGSTKQLIPEMRGLSSSGLVQFFIRACKLKWDAEHADRIDEDAPASRDPSLARTESVVSDGEHEDGGNVQAGGASRGRGGGRGRGRGRGVRGRGRGRGRLERRASARAPLGSDDPGPSLGKRSHPDSDGGDEDGSKSTTAKRQK